jgi:hypothetical protein
MSVAQKAIGVAWGIDSSTVYTGVATVLKANPTSQQFNRSASLVEMPDKNGETIGAVFFNKIDELDLRVYPSDNTIALSNTAGGTFGMGAGNTLNPGDKFVVTSANDADLAGTYIVIKLGKTKKVGTYCEFDISVKRWPTDISTPIV